MQYTTNQHSHHHPGNDRPHHGSAALTGRDQHGNTDQVAGVGDKAGHPVQLLDRDGTLLQQVDRNSHHGGAAGQILGGKRQHGNHRKADQTEEGREYRLQQGNGAGRLEDIDEEDRQDQHRNSVEDDPHRLLAADDHQVEGRGLAHLFRRWLEDGFGVAPVVDRPGKQVVGNRCRCQAPDDRGQHDNSKVEPDCHHGEDNIGLGQGQDHGQGGRNLPLRGAVLLHDRQGGERGGKADQQHLHDGKGAGAGNAETPQHRLNGPGNKGQNTAGFDHLHDGHHDDQHRQQYVKSQFQSGFAGGKHDFDQLFHQVNSPLSCRFEGQGTLIRFTRVQDQLDAIEYFSYSLY